MRLLQVVLGVLAGPVLVASLAVPFQLGPFLAQQRLRSAEWETKNQNNPDELRNTAIEALGLWWGDPHDAFIMLGLYGNASSIPALRRALSRMPNDGDGPGCTRDHGLEALATLEHRKSP